VIERLFLLAPITAFCVLVAAAESMPAVKTAAAAQTSPAPYKICKSTYALCTTARCTLIAGEAGAVSCGCTVRTGYSAATTACKAARQTPAGESIVSRYYPVTSRAICRNNRPWANCLDAPCLIDKNDPSKANCTCKIAKDEGPYVIVSKSYSATTCTTGIVSSATVQQSDEITEFLISQKFLREYSGKGVTPAPSP